MEYIIFILFLVIIALVIKIAKTKKQYKPDLKELKNEEIQTVEEVKIEKIPYIRKNLMTKNEWLFYKQLKPIADKMNYAILCKTRLADLVDIENGLSKSEWQTAFNKINKKHIDFILCKPENLYPILLIELDDNSHEKAERKERDKFIEKIFEKTGYKLLRTNGTGDLESKIAKLIAE